MGDITKIQWTDKTINFWQGCEKVSPGCDLCYMYSDKYRYGQDPTKVVLSKPATFNQPLRWQRDADKAQTHVKVFTSSWTDFFHNDADAWRASAWDIIRTTPRLHYQILTKRHALIKRRLPADWGAGYNNVWLGVTGEDQAWAKRRLHELLQIPARVRFLSYEPALGPIDISAELATGLLHWVIIGGESDPNWQKARPFDPAWAQDVIAQCRQYNVAVFVKQMGSQVAHVQNLRHKKGGDVLEWDRALQVRDFPVLPEFADDAIRCDICTRRDLTGDQVRVIKGVRVCYSCLPDMLATIGPARL